MEPTAITIKKMGNRNNPFFLPYTISILLHAVVITVFILNPDFSYRKKDTPSIINVSLVPVRRNPAPANKPPVKEKTKTEPVQEKKETPKPAKKAVPVPVKDATSAPVVKKIKRSLKKKTFKPKKVVKSAVKELEKKVDQTRPDPRPAAFESLRKKVQEQEAERQKLEDEKQQNETASVDNATGGGISGGKQAELVDLYRLEIAFQIQKNWALSEQLAGLKANLQSSLVFKVMPSGEIKDIFFTDRSGNSYLDDSAYKAVIKSNPVDPHPKGVIAPYVEMGLRFTPEGVN